MSRTFKLEFGMDNAAFEEPEVEIARILRDLADRINEGGAGVPSEYMIRDVNGNTVGRAVITGSVYDR